MTRRRWTARRRLVALVLLAPAACTVGPDYVPPELDTPDGWHSADDSTAGPVDAWWTLLGDDQLTALITRARAGNLDLRSALWRIQAARAALGVARGDWFPDLDGVGSYERSRVSANGPAAQPAVPLPISPLVSNRSITSVGVDASWEVDVFGRIRRAVEAAGADVDVTVEDAHDIEVILLADVAQTYVEAITVRERLDIVRRNVEAQGATLDLTRSRLEAELAPALDVAQAESNLALTRSALPALEAALDNALYRLALLLGEMPGTEHGLAVDRPIPAPPPLSGLGLPRDLLSRRPDVRSAERRLAAQSARIGVAVAELYPRFSILGGYGYESLDGSATLDSDSRTFFVGPSFRWNLLDGGRVRGNIEVQDALAEQTRVELERALLVALQEVESSLTSYHHEQERASLLDEAARAADRAVGYVRDVYREGLADFQNVLDAERTLFQAQDQAALSHGAVAQHWIRLYRALGGGWTDAQIVAEPPP